MEVSKWNKFTFQHPQPSQTKVWFEKKNEMMEKFSGACWSDQNNVSHIQLELVESDLNEKLAKNISFWFLVNFSFESDSTNSSRLCETSLRSLQPAPENFSLLFNSNANGWCAVWLYFTNLFLFDKFSLLSLKWFWASANLFFSLHQNFFSWHIFNHE